MRELWKDRSFSPENGEKEPFKKGGYMKKFLFLLILSLICFCAHLSSKDDVLAQKELLQKAENMVAKLKSATFNQLVPDSLIAQNITELTASKDWCPINLNAARHDIYDVWICPAFENKNQCWDALDASIPDRSPQNRRYVFESNGLPADLDRPMAEARKLVLQIGKNFLNDPKNLAAFYKAKKGFILNEAKKGKGKGLYCFAKNAETARAGLEAFNNPEFRVLRTELLAAKKEYFEKSAHQDEAATAYYAVRDKLLNDLEDVEPENNEFYRQVQGWHPGNYFNEITASVPKGKESLYSDFTVVMGQYTKAHDDSQLAYERSHDIEKRMKEMTLDFDASMFAGRRFDDGGQELVDAWIKVATDLEICLFGLLPKRVPDTKMPDLKTF